MFEELKAKIAVITGSASGLGQAISVKLAQQGVIVVGIDRDEQGGAATKTMIEAAGNIAYFEKADLADASGDQKGICKNPRTNRSGGYSGKQRRYVQTHDLLQRPPRNYGI